MIHKPLLTPKDICTHCKRPRRWVAGAAHCNHKNYPKYCGVCVVRQGATA